MCSVRTRTPTPERSVIRICGELRWPARTFSGVAALIVSHFGGEGFTAEECKKRLLNGYRPMGGLIPDDQLGDIGVGLLDAAAALMDDPGTAPANVDDAEVSSERQ